MSEIFLSYSRADREIARAIADELHKLGVDVWWDHELAAGEDFRRRITEMLKEVQAAIVIWSRNSVESKWVISEAAAAGEKKILIPVRVDRSELPIDFRLLHTDDLCDWTVGQEQLPASFLKAIGERIGRELSYATPAVAPGAVTRFTRQVTQTWYEDFETMLYFFMGQCLACFLANLSVAYLALCVGNKTFTPSTAMACAEVSPLRGSESLPYYLFALLVGFLVAPLYMRPVLASRRVARAVPLFLLAAILSLVSCYVAFEFYERFGPATMLYVGPTTLTLLLVTSLAHRSLQSRQGV